MNNLDSKKTLSEHKRIIKKRKILNLLYRDFYKIFASVKIPKGKKIELGSGAGFIKEIIPEIVTSDVIKGEDIDLVFSASKIPFANKSVSAFYMLNTFHHIKNCEESLKEMERVLKPGGKIVMIEPFNTLWGAFIYKYFHYEDFDSKARWKIQGKGRLSDANDALPWIVFERDREIFEQKFPKLKIKKIDLHTPFSYLISGRLTGTQLLPSFIYPLFRSLEESLGFLNNFLAMFATIVVEKTK